MIDLEKFYSLAADCGFTHTGPLDAATLRFRTEVRDMCATNRCGAYGRRWCCPPACGTIEQATARASAYSVGIIVQTVAELEDEFDGETMMEANERHKESFYRLLPRVRELAPGMLPMGAGACTLCEECTYPDSPCRHPELSYPSMEAYGLVVSDVCEANGVKYYYGRNTIAYTSCILLE